MSKTVFLDLPSQISQVYHPTILNGRTKFVIEDAFFEIPNQEHRMPQWMSPHLHIILEKLLKHYPDSIIPTLLGIPYHLLHGFTCGYNIKEIIWFLRQYYHKRGEA